MTRLMFDSTAAADIPASAAMVAGYLPPSRYAWSAAAWQLFPNAVKVRISITASLNDGDVLDVEQGDATPAEAPGWVAMRRRAGADPTVYCSLSLWAAVRAEFQRQGVPEPHYWIARYDNNPVIPAGAVAKQYANEPLAGGHYDLSIVADHWPGVDQENDMAGEIADALAKWMFDRMAGLPVGHQFKGIHPGDMLLNATGYAKAASETGGRSEAKLDALGHTLSDDEANIIAAVRAQPTGGQVDVPALAAALNQLGTLTARMPDDQVQQLVAELNKIPVATRQILAAALAGGAP